MTGRLTTYFPNLKSICYIDDNEVYLDKERVTVDNTVTSGYVRLGGVQTLNEIDSVTGVYEVTDSLVFVGSVPNGNVLKVIEAVKSALLNCFIIIKSVTTDKVLIAESEGIDLKKFTDVVLIKVEYDYIFTEAINERNNIDMCSC